MAYLIKISISFRKSFSNFIFSVKIFCYSLIILCYDPILNIKWKSLQKQIRRQSLYICNKYENFLNNINLPNLPINGVRTQSLKSTIASHYQVKVLVLTYLNLNLNRNESTRRSGSIKKLF